MLWRIQPSQPSRLHETDSDNLRSFWTFAALTKLRYTVEFLRNSEIVFW